MRAKGLTLGGKPGWQGARAWGYVWGGRARANVGWAGVGGQGGRADCGWAGALARGGPGVAARVRAAPSQPRPARRGRGRGLAGVLRSESQSDPLLATSTHTRAVLRPPILSNWSLTQLSTKLTRQLERCSSSSLLQPCGGLQVVKVSNTGSSATLSTRTHTTSTLQPTTTPSPARANLSLA